MSARTSKSKAIERRRNPFALATLIAVAVAVVAVPGAFIAGQPALALAIGAVAAAVVYLSISSAWRWIGTRATPLAKNEAVAFTTSARSDSASGGTVTVTNRRVYFEPATSLFIGNRGSSAKGWELANNSIAGIRRASQDPTGQSRGGAQRIVLESKTESHWLQPREFDALAEAIAKATGRVLGQG